MVIAGEFSAAWNKYLAGIFNIGRAFLIKVTHWTKAAAVIKLTVLKLHLRLFKNHRRFLSCGIVARPSGIGFSLAARH